MSSQGTVRYLCFLCFLAFFPPTFAWPLWMVLPAESIVVTSTLTFLPRLLAPFFVSFTFTIPDWPPAIVAVALPRTRFFPFFFFFAAAVPFLPFFLDFLPNSLIWTWQG